LSNKGFKGETTEYRRDMAMKKQIIAIFLVVVLSVGCFSGCLEWEPEDTNEQPTVSITYPSEGAVVSQLVIISGIAADPDGDNELVSVEVKIGDDDWEIASGTTKWSYDWNVYGLDDAVYVISVRAWDGKVYSDVEQISVQVDNPETVESDAHRWAVFIVAANFPEDNESKLGNGGFYLAEEIAAYLLESSGYATSNIIILFDDGWIRTDNGFGEREMTLQERPHDYDITYGSATKQNVIETFEHIIAESNQYRDSEVFIWIFNHGYGDANNSLTGGQILQRSHIFIWDDIISDREVGQLLGPLKSQKVCIIVDACYCGGFADKTIYNLPTLLLLRSGLPQNGRVVISGASKFKQGYASTTEGPVFTLLWFEGLTTGNADGYRPSLLATGRPTNLRLFKDGKVSVEEAFYYARYILRTDETLEDYRSMEPQINDRYPHRGVLRSIRGLILGEN
jgi:hypothetical protein